ncbi:hypothetical protein K504DRAFT_445979 [Pleomassaria siparia CBS 279.74]|uniref:Zn(2)-C6 fungal-type domain-containing protein n=1 Tax=Pleomassaria siparia CBS 279.74 TaxID=1314801 RepID=A0A6G1KRG9_9PLEO|nr:hypothetical protein K504DRAFT_445979 [Pleomassaria siparia CBS 279.74]
MTDDMSQTSELALSRKRKRKPRTVLSCNDCRRRKLKCDRELPCNRCINGGVAHTCVYGWSGSSLPLLGVSLVTASDEPQPQQAPLTSQLSRPLATVATETCHTRASSTNHVIQPKTSPVTTMLKDDKVEQLERRVASLEAHLLSFTATSENQPQVSKTLLQPSTSAHQSGRALTGLFKGRNQRTFFYGPTSPLTLVVHFPEIRPFMKDIYMSPHLEQLQNDIKKVEDRARSKEVTNRILSVPYLWSLLPDRITVDLLVKKYFETFETTYRIVHAPTFWLDYQTFWDSPPSCNSDMEALVLAILACTICTSTHDSTKYDPNGSIFRSKAIIWIKACEYWLKRQSNKYRTLATVQVRCLRILALMSTCMKTKEIYQETQAHMAFMKSSGMHREPSLLGCRCSVFEGEMRRRLWATSLELELQTSIDKGASSVLSSLEYDCAPPRNINDSELSADMQQLPASQPTRVFTDTSFLHCSLETAKLRTKLCAITNGLQYGPELPDIMRFEEEIQDGLETIPKWTDLRSFQAWTLLDLQLRQFLVIIHTPRALQTQLRVKPDHRYSMLTCLEQSTMLMDRHINLMDSGNYSLCCIRSDYYRAGLLTCFITYHAASASDNLIYRVAKSVFGDTMEKALRLHEERALRPGRGSHQHWYISAAYGFVSVKLDPPRIEVFKRQAVDRVARLLYKILSLQEPSAEYLANDVVLANSSTAAEVGTNSATNIDESSALPPEAFPNIGLRLDAGGMDFGNTSEWMLDDFWDFNDLPVVPFND